MKKMHQVLFIIIGIFNLIFGMVLNIGIFASGGPGSYKNLLVTIIYIIIWIAIIYFSKKFRLISTIQLALTVWIITTIVSIVMILANVYDKVDFSFIIPLAILFWGQLYGISLWASDKITGIITLIISIGFVILSIYNLKRLSSEYNIETIRN